MYTSTPSHLPDPPFRFFEGLVPRLEYEVSVPVTRFICVCVCVCVCVGGGGGGGWLRDDTTSALNTIIEAFGNTVETWL